MKEPSILTVLMAWRLNGSNDDQLVPTSSTDSWTPISEMAGGRRRPSSPRRRPRSPRGSAARSGTRSRRRASATASDTSPRWSWSMVQLTPSWMLRRPVAGLLARRHQRSSGSGARCPRWPRPGRDQVVGRDAVPGSGARHRTRASMPRSRPVGEVHHRQVLQVGSPRSGRRSARRRSACARRLSGDPDPPPPQGASHGIWCHVDASSAFALHLSDSGDSRRPGPAGARLGAATSGIARSRRRRPGGRPGRSPGSTGTAVPGPPRRRPGRPAARHHRGPPGWRRSRRRPGARPGTGRFRPCPPACRTGPGARWPPPRPCPPVPRSGRRPPRWPPARRSRS